MSFGLSPSIDIQERDFISPGRQTANRFAAMVGNFNWGPVLDRVYVGEEKDVIENFHGPDANNYKDWYAANNFLSYNDKLYMVRAIKADGSNNAGVILFSEPTVKLNITMITEGGVFAVGEELIGKTSAGRAEIIHIDGNNLYVLMAEGSFEEDEVLEGPFEEPAVEGVQATLNTITSDVDSLAFATLKKNEDDDITITHADYQKFKVLAKYPGVYGNNISISIADSTTFATALVKTGQTFKNLFEFAPVAGEIAIAVLLSGVVVETFVVSLTPGSKNYRGQSNYIETYVNRYSKYIYIYNNVDVTDVNSVVNVSLTGGAHVAPEAADYIAGYNLFQNAEEIDVDVIFCGNASEIASGETVVQHIIDNIIDTRKDCRFVISATEEDVVGAAIADGVDNMMTYVNTTINKDSSFASFYGNYKYQFDKYNDVYRWMPISGDVAGIYCLGQAWEAPAGINRGTIKNCIKLALNPSESYRDLMYPAGINPVYTMKGVGHVVMGQKTLKTSTASLFSRVDIRGLFILLEKNAKDVARFYQFQKNTPFERRRFVSDVEPLFKQVQGLGGIEEYLIVCDETNNTDEVRTALTMVADFYIKPTHSAEWIRLNFNATQATVNFEEIVASPYQA